VVADDISHFKVGNYNNNNHRKADYIYGSELLLPPENIVKNCAQSLKLTNSFHQLPAQFVATVTKRNSLPDPVHNPNVTEAVI